MNATSAEMPEVVDREFSVHVDGGTIRIPLVVDKPKTPEAQMKNSESIDEVVPWFLEQCGFTMEPKGIASPERVLMILVLHLVGTGRFSNLWKRLVRRRIDPKIANNRVWRNATTIKNGMIKFAPGFWLNLLSAITCDVNPELWKINRTLATFKQLAEEFGIDPKTRLFPFMIMRTIAEINLVEVVETKAFVDYLYARPVDRMTVMTHVGVLRSLQYPTKAEDLDDIEDAWVIALATSRFRYYPFVPETVSSGTMPVLTARIARDEERALAVQRDRARKAELAANPDLVVGAPNDEDDGNKGVDATRLAPAVSTTRSSSSPPPPPPPPPYVPYACAIGGKLPPACSAAALCDAIDALETPVVDDAKRAAFDRATTGALSALRSDYCAAIGESEAANPVAIFRSMVVCMLGGEDWMALHARLLGSLKRITDPVAVRNVLGRMTPPMIVDFMNVFDLTGVHSVSMEASQYFGKLSSVIAPTFTPSALDVAAKDMVKMLLVIFYTQWDYAVEAKLVPKLEFSRLWRGMFGWELDQKLLDGITECKKTCPILPAAIRAQAIKLAFTKL